MSNVSEVDEINNIDEVLEALRKVKAYCKDNTCGTCKLRKRNNRCGVVADTPNNWELKAKTYYM